MFVVAVVAAVVGRCHYWLCTVVVSRRGGQYGTGADTPAVR